MDSPRILDVSISFQCPRCSKLTYFEAGAVKAFSIEGGIDYCVCCNLPVEWMLEMKALSDRPAEELDG